MYVLEGLPYDERKRVERIIHWQGRRSRGWWGGRPFTRTLSLSDPPAMLFRRCGNVSDMVRACTLVMSWSETRATEMPARVLAWLHPEGTVVRCDRCLRNYLAVQEYFQVWVSSRLEGDPLPRSRDVRTLEGGQITEAEIRCIVRWVCARLDEPEPGEDDDLPPAA